MSLNRAAQDNIRETCASADVDLRLRLCVSCRATALGSLEFEKYIAAICL